MFRGRKTREDVDRGGKAASESLTVYSVVYHPDFARNFKRVRKLLQLAYDKACDRINGSEPKVAEANVLTEAFNSHVDGLRQVIAHAQFGRLPPVTHGGVPCGSSKQYLVNGWVTTIILDVPEKIAHIYYIEPCDPTRDRLNTLTGGLVGD